MNDNFTPEQMKQIEDAKLLIPDDMVVEMISDDRLTAKQMEHLIVIACSHPKAAIDFFQLSDAENHEITMEIRQEVSKKAAAYIKDNYRQSISRKMNEQLDSEADIRGGWDLSDMER